MSSRWHPGRSWPLGGTTLAGCPPAATTLASLAVHLPHCSGLACPWAARLWVRLGATELLSQVSQPLYPLGLCPISTSLVPFRVYLGESCVGPSASPPLLSKISLGQTCLTSPGCLSAPIPAQPCPAPPLSCAAHWASHQAASGPVLALGHCRRQQGRVEKPLPRFVAADQSAIFLCPT